MKKNTKYIVVGAVLLVIVLIWFGGGENRDLISNQFGGDGEGGSPPVEGAPVGNLTLAKLGGGEISLESYRGEKPVILDYFATWCPNCRRDMPKLSGFYDKYKDQVEVIGINLQERESTVENYIESAQISFPIALDPQGIAAREFAVQFTNYHVLINKDGTIAGVVPGDITEEQVLALINSQPFEVPENASLEQIEL